MDLKELRYFRIIAELGSFSKAAAQLRVAQPALSRQMKKLEHSLGVDLLVRTHKGVFLTSAGDALLKRSQGLEEEVKDICREVSGFSEKVVGSVHIALQYPASLYLGPELIKEYQSKFPLVSARVYDGYSKAIVDRLLRKEVDAAIIDSLTHELADLVTIPLWMEQLYLFGPKCAASKPIFQRDTVTLEEISDLPIVIPSQSSSLRRMIDAAFQKKDLKFEPIVEADGQLLNCEMVKAGIGYTIFPHEAFWEQEQEGLLISRKIEPEIRRTTSLVTHKLLLDDSRMSPLIESMYIKAMRLARSGKLGEVALYNPPEFFSHLADEVAAKELQSVA